MEKNYDVVARPKHYNTGKIEVIEFIEDKKLNFHLGNAVKYVSRAGKKDPNKHIEDLEKAVWYIEREIECLKGTQGLPVRRPNDMRLRQEELAKKSAFEQFKLRAEQAEMAKQIEMELDSWRQEDLSKRNDFGYYTGKE